MNDNRKFWERVAKFYTRMQEKSNCEIYNIVIERCKKYLKADDNVLELACGTGQFTLELCNCVKHWEATDYSAKMIDCLRKRMDELSVNDTAKSIKTVVNLSVEDATDLSYGASRFNVVIMANGLHVMPEPDKALSEIERVLKPSGLFIVPMFVYEGKVNKPRLWILEHLGFKTFHHWTLSGLEQYLVKHGFQIVESDIIQGKMLPEGFVVCRK